MNNLKNMEVNVRNYALKYFHRETIAKDIEQYFHDIVLQESKV